MCCTEQCSSPHGNNSYVRSGSLIDKFNNRGGNGGGGGWLDCGGGYKITGCMDSDVLGWSFFFNGLE